MAIFVLWKLSQDNVKFLCELCDLCAGIVREFRKNENLRAGCFDWLLKMINFVASKGKSGVSRLFRCYTVAPAV